MGPQRRGGVYFTLCYSIICYDRRVVMGEGGGSFDC